MASDVFIVPLNNERHGPRELQLTLNVRTHSGRGTLMKSDNCLDLGTRGASLSRSSSPIKFIASIRARFRFALLINDGDCEHRPQNRDASRLVINDPLNIRLTYTPGPIIAAASEYLAYFFARLPRSDVYKPIKLHAMKRN